MLRVLHGPFHPELEDAFLAELRAVRRKKPLAPVVVVAPSRRLARHLAILAASADPRGVANVRFLNLFAFARALDDETPDPGGRLVEDDLLHERLVVGIVEREFADRPYLRHALRIPGTARAILGALQELRAGAVDPADALEAMREGHVTGGEDSVKLGELLSLHYYYARELRDRGWRDRADLVLRAAELAPRSRWLASQEAVFYYGFYELVQTQLDLFNRVSRAFPTVAFYPYADKPEYAFARDFFTNAIVGDKRALAPLLFGHAPRRRVVSASGPRDELWAAAKEILKQHDRGVPFEEIAVIARTLEPYAELLEPVLRENRIPFESSARVRQPVEREIALLSLADDDFPRDRVMALLEGDDVPSWDLVTRRLGIGRGRAEWERRLFPWDGRDWRDESDERWTGRVPPIEAARMSTLVAAVRALMARVTGPERGTWSEQASWARGLIGERPEIDSLAALDGVAPSPTGAEFRAALRAELREATRPAGADNVRGVQVLDAMAARGLSFKSVILLGLNERVWPRTILEDPFLPDGVRTQLKFRLGSALPQKLAGYDEERMLFAMACGAAREELTIFWQRSDERGRLQVRSPFVEPGRESIQRRPAAKLEKAALETLTYKELAVRAVLQPGGSAAHAEAVARAFGGDAATFAESAHFLRMIDDDRALGPRDGFVGVLDGLWAPLAERGLSPTSLETFADCGFKFFAQKALSLEPLDAPEDSFEPDALETGSLYHLILERLFKKLAGRPPAESFEQIRATFDAVLEDTFRAFEKGRTIPFPVLWEAQQRRMRIVLEAYLKVDLAQRDGFKPLAFEQELGGTLPLPLGRHSNVRFMGYADRLDVRDDGTFRVIDYKSARSSKYVIRMPTGVVKRRYLQPPIYFLLAERYLAEQGRKPRRAESLSGYRFLREYAEPGRRPEFWLTATDWEIIEREFSAELASMLDDLRDGFFPIRESRSCDWCDFSEMCRRRHAPTRWRAARATAEEEQE